MNLQAQEKERVKRIKEKPKDCPKEPRVRTKVPKAHAKVQTSEMGQDGNDDMSWIHEELSPDERNDGCSFDELNDDRNCVGWREDCEQMCRVSVSSLSLESSGWAEMKHNSGN